LIGAHDGHALQALGVGLAPVGHEVVVGAAERGLIIRFSDFTDSERGGGIEEREIDPFLGQVGQHLLRRVGVAPQIAVGRLATIPLGAGKEGDAAAVLLRQILLVAPVREVHDMAVAVHDEDPVTHDALPPRGIQHLVRRFLENPSGQAGRDRRPSPCYVFDKNWLEDRRRR